MSLVSFPFPIVHACRKMSILPRLPTASQHLVLVSSHLPLLLCSAIVFVIVLKATYNLYFHPLAKFPGPRLAAASSWWEVYVELVRGQPWSLRLVELHEVYGMLFEGLIPRIADIDEVYSGDIVRIGPNEVCTRCHFCCRLF